MTFQITTPTGGSDSLNFKNFSGTSIGSITATDGSGLQIQTGTNSNTGISITANSQIVIGAGQAYGTNPITLIGNTAGQTISIINNAMTGNTPLNNLALRIAANGSGADCTINFTDSITYNGFIGMQGGKLNFGASSTTPQMTINAAGAITKPLTPTFKVYGGAGTSATSLTLTGSTTPASIVSFNVGSNYNNTNGRFTAPVAGYYFVWLVARTNNSSATSASIYINGASFSGNVYWETGTNDTFVNHFGVSSVYYLNANDYVSLSLGAGITFDQNDQWGAYLLG
jgi:hypothetical protein